MAKGVLWIGESSGLRHFQSEFEKIHNIPFAGVEHADKGLEMILSRPFGLMVVEQMVAAGNLFMPPGLETGDHEGIACYVIRNARASPLNSTTPIVVPYFDKLRLRDTARMEERLLQAGATELVRKHSESAYMNPVEFAGYLVRKYLK